MSVGNAPIQSAPTRTGLLARHPLVSFFVMAYAFTWIAWSPWVLSEDGVGLLPFRLSGAASGLLNAAAIFLGPTLAGLIMTGVTEGRAGVRRLLRRIVLWRVGVAAYRRLDLSHSPLMPMASASKSSRCPQLPHGTFTTPLASVRSRSPASRSALT